MRIRFPSSAASSKMRRAKTEDGTNMSAGQQRMNASTTQPSAGWAAAALIFIGALGLFGTLASGAPGQETETPRKLPKDGPKGARILITLDWGEVPLRERLVEFGKKYNRGIFLVRRVDPDQRIDLSARELPVEGVLALAAEKLKLGDCAV